MDGIAQHSSLRWVRLQVIPLTSRQAGAFGKRTLQVQPMHASRAQITTGQGSNQNFVVDVNVDQSYPWLRFSRFMVSTAWPNSVVCVLRSPNDAKPTSLSASI